MASLPPAPTPDASLSEALRSVLPDLSVGALLGFATGLALRKVSRLALTLLGLLFVTVQLLAFWDILSVNWLRVQALADPLLRQGGEAGAAWLGRVLTANLPFAGAYAAGLVLGLRARG
ncbi:hypothetical protein F8S09_05445 [Deinococcus sp. SDU3-2]|uniref:FUN14 family protein n=1 Tax=Deinococcus terrestris TaxID=2651870 RepID=A0A7X1NUN8_9DEIO|nr:FUN14 domain-containing protein [Deinococcus terrestris]MPY66142.1 hypothetical protein [Deinococcus terrestris]